jgi:hypothetical protein
MIDKEKLRRKRIRDEWWTLFNKECHFDTKYFAAVKAAQDTFWHVLSKDGADAYKQQWYKHFTSLLLSCEQCIWYSWNSIRNDWHIRRPEQDLNDYVYNRVRIDSEWGSYHDFKDYCLDI